ncbi:MAG: hypothetical protein QW707_07175 [Candidatus Bathyarchaeia archaeon]
MYLFLRRKNKKAAVTVVHSEPKKPTLDECISLLWKVANQTVHPYVLRQEEVTLARFMERLGLVKVLEDEEAITHRKRLVAIAKCGFHCEECGNFEGYKLHSWKNPRGEVQSYQNPLPKCKVNGFIMTSTLGKGRACGKFLPKALEGVS